MARSTHAYRAPVCLFFWRYPPQGWHTKYARDNFGIFPYAITELSPAFVKAAKECVGFMYLSDANLPNPWDVLPTYFPALLQALQS